MLIIAPKFFFDLGFDKNTANLIIILSQTPSALGAIFGGWYADRLVQRSQASRLKFLTMSLLIPIPFLITAFLLPYSYVGPEAGFGVFWTTSLYPLGFILIGIGSFFATIPGNNYFAVIEAANEPELRSTIISFQKVNDNLGSAIGPGLAATLSVFFSSHFGLRWGDPFAVTIAILFWIPCAYFWFRAMKTIEHDVQQMKSLLLERAKELDQNLKPK
jgi:MFS family permease